jgi:hypothetical protein
LRREVKKITIPCLEHRWSIVANRLTEYAENVTSQNGEDGMIRELLERLGIRSGWAVEFGAWDGRHLSNTFSLWHDRGWNAVLIEGDESKFEDLRRMTAGYDGVHILNAWVSDSGRFALDALLSRAGVPRDFDVLSVDIDGDDYYVWASLTEFQPKVVAIEYNVSFPPHVSHVQPKGDYCGSSALAFCQLSEARGYSLLDLTRTNMIFVRDDLKLEPELARAPLSSLFPYEELIFAWSDLLGRTHLETPGPWGFRPPLRLSRNVRRLGRQFVIDSMKRALTLDRRAYAGALRRLAGGPPRQR